MTSARRTAAVLALALVATACAASVPGEPGGRPLAAAAPARPDSAPAPQSRRLEASENVYAATTSHEVPERLAHLPHRVYVPNNQGDTVDVIDPKTFRIVDHYRVGRGPHHVTPSWDLRWLYVGNTASNTITVVDPETGRPRRTVNIRDPYNIYASPNGHRLIVVAERFRQLDFRDPRTLRLIRSVEIPWAGVDHGDFTADGRYIFLSTEFSGMVAKVDVSRMALVGRVEVGGLPIDAKLSPDGAVLYVANQGRHGVSVVDVRRMREIKFIPTARGAHGLQVSRDATKLYVSNRLAGSISVIDFARRRVVATWRIGGSPDMLQTSPDGEQLWASGRFHNEVYVVNTRTGRLIKKIRVGSRPHGLTYFPNVGRFSIGHNGVYR